MVTREDVDSFLLRLEQEYGEVETGMWILQSGIEGAGLVIHYSPPLLLLRVKVMEVPEEEGTCARLYRRLLELNATDLIHGAYGVDGDDVILSESLELENLDFSEFQASVDSMQLALASHLEVLSPFRDCGEAETKREPGASAPSPAS